MRILAITGSSRDQSSNSALLGAIADLAPPHTEVTYHPLHELPLYQADLDHTPLPQQVIAWRQAVADSQAVVIATPEYLHNMPALLKNALEWLTTSGELHGKKTLPITFTPAPPRGQQAMQSLLWSLQALDCNILPPIAVYQSAVQIADGKLTGSAADIDMILYGISLLTAV